MISKFVSKLIQSLPTWEVTKYYGRVCIYQIKCLKYKVQTSEAWFNFKCKFMPGSLRNELECEEAIQPKAKEKQPKEEKVPKKKESLETVAHQTQSQYNAKKKDNNNCLPNSFNNVGSSYVADEFVTTSKKAKKNEKYQGNENYSIREDYTGKKERKVKHAQ